MSYRNPVIPGFHPDPSVCCVGEDYYLVTSSFEYFPGVPIFHSRDLVHWRQIGHCLTRNSQLPLEGVRASGGIFAPTIRHHQGRFYMVTTNVTAGGHFYVYSNDPAGEWSEPIWVDIGVHGIDPSLLFDDDGSVYFTANKGRQTGIYQAILDVETGKPLGEARFLCEGTGGKAPEAPHLYRIDDTYYLMLAEGGTERGHMVTIARSDSPWGPFEPCPNNPILSHRSTDEPIQATGHADLLQAHDGSWWMVFLGVRPAGSYPPLHHLGRETYLSPVRWVEGWPVVGKDGIVPLVVEAETLPAMPWPDRPARDGFKEPELALCWNFLRNPRPEDWSLNERPGWLTLRGSSVSLDEEGSPAFIGRRQEHFGCSAATLVDFQPQNDGEEAGLTALMNNRHHYEIAVTRHEERRQVMVRRRIGSLRKIVAQEPLEEGPIVLAIEADAEQYSFAFGKPEGRRHTLATGETRYLATEVAGGFTGVYLGMYAWGGGQRCQVPVHFDWFDYKPQ